MSLKGTPASRGDVKELSRSVSAHTWTCVITKLTVVIVACILYMCNVHAHRWVNDPGKGTELKV